MSEQEIWEAALVKCGYWNKQEIEQVTCYDCSQPHTYPVYKTAPALGDAGAVVAMLEWLARQGYVVMIREEPKYYEKPARFVVIVDRNPQLVFRFVLLPIALAAAVNEVQP